MHFSFIMQMRRAAFFSPAPLLLVNIQEGGGSMCRPRVCPNSGAGSFQVPDYVTARRGRSVKCGRQMCPSFARFEGWVVSILHGPSFPMIHCGSKRFGPTGAAMVDHSGKSWTKEQTDQFIKLRGENHHLFTGAKNSATVAW
ncbi:hypothetical protein AMECASPLE_039085, partial [Ameca splendens]